MKRKTLFLLALFTTMAAGAQIDPAGTADIDWSEDTTEITTIQDIINVQQRQASRNATESHYAKVWGRRGFLNFAFNSGKLKPKGAIPTGVPGLNTGIVANMSSDWGATFQYGRSYRLHKTPIANIVNFYIDYTGLDLGVNHYKAEGNESLYDSNNKFTVGSDSYFYTPWNLEKYEVNYAMTLGPSLTIAPFNLMRNRYLHYFKLNFYYHIGYHASMLFMTGSDKLDANQGTGNTEKKNRETIADSPKIDWGHGLTQSFGINLSWKTIGVGYEHRTRKVKYKSMSTSEFGKEKYEFELPDSRVYIQLRM